MQRFRVRAPLALAAALVLVGAVALARSMGDARAQDATPAAMAGHPLVGTWLLTFANLPGTLDLNTYGADGTVVQSGPAGEGAGAWTATGPASAAMTLVLLEVAGGPAPVVIHAAMDVDAAAGTFDGTFTIEGVPGGPTAFHGARVVVGPVAIPAHGPLTAATPAA